MYRAQIEVPGESDGAVVKALFDVCDTLGVKKEDITASTAPEATYSLTIHVVPDVKEKE
jgi:hypothetical protein